MKNGFIIYTEPGDNRGFATKTYLNRVGMNYEERPLHELRADGAMEYTLTPEAQKLVDQFQFRVAPIVVAVKDGKEVEYWCNYRMDKLLAYSHGDML